MLNHWTGMGRITHDLELKSTQSGTPVISFTVAIDRGYKSQDGEKQTNFINVVAWRQTAEFVSRYFHKGSMICVEGAINVRSYTAQDGSKRYVTEVVADRVHFTGEKSNDAPAASTGTASQYIPDAYKTNQSGFEEINNDDDLPF